MRARQEARRAGESRVQRRGNNHQTVVTQQIKTRQPAPQKTSLEAGARGNRRRTAQDGASERSKKRKQGGKRGRSKEKNAEAALEKKGDTTT